MNQKTAIPAIGTKDNAAFRAENEKLGIFNFMLKGLCKGLAIVAMAAALGGCPNPTQTEQVDTDQIWYNNAGGHWKTYDDNTQYGHGSHAFGAYETTQEPTTEAKGSEHAFCTVCGYENVREIPQLIVEREDSDNAWHNDANGHWKDYDDGEAYAQGEHVAGQWTQTQAPTYDAVGEETTNCTVCGYHMTREVAKLTETMATSVTDIWVTTSDASFLSQGIVTDKMNRFRLDFRGQADTIAEQYGSQGSDSELGYDSTFANTVVTAQQTLHNTYTNNATAGLIQLANNTLQSTIFNAVTGLFGVDTAAATAFGNKLEAYRKATYIVQRSRDGGAAPTIADKTEEFNNFCTANGITVSGSPADMVASLRADLESTMPRAAGAARFNLLQQVSDQSQWDAYINDVLAVGLEPNGSGILTAAAPQRLHETTIMAGEQYLAMDERRRIQEANGLYV